MTRTLIAAGTLMVGLSAGVGTLRSEPDLKAKFVVDGKQLKTIVDASMGHPLGDKLISGWHYRSKETRELAMDDFGNPAMLAVEQGEALWTELDGSAGKSCASCHDDAAESMKGVRARLPKWDAKKNKPVSLQHLVNQCRTERMGAKAWKWESNEMLGMAAFIGLQSRGMPMNINVDGPIKQWIEKGKKIYYTPVGQLEMACAGCHENYNGQMIRADHLSQGHINGFPTYRLKWRKIGSMHRRFSGCMKNIRAQPYKRGSDEFVALEAYLASRGAGLAIESPSLRQ